MEQIEKVCSLESKLIFISMYSIRILSILAIIAKTRKIFKKKLCSEALKMEARERTQRKCQELFQQFVMEGLTPNQAAAKAIRVIKGNLYIEA